jgi:exodeoxyribonuclease VII large subunit
LRVRAAQRETRDAAARLARLAPRAVESRRPLPETLARRIAARAVDRLRRDAARIAALERLAGELRPERTLRRGFSITRGPDGAVLRDAAKVLPGTRLSTELHRGRVESTVDRAVGAPARRAEVSDLESPGKEPS